jgi:hypothetical protein
MPSEGQYSEINLQFLDYQQPDSAVSGDVRLTCTALGLKIFKSMALQLFCGL